MQAPLGFALEITSGSTFLGKGARRARVIALGDADLFRNELLRDVPGNAPLVQNMIQWLIGGDKYQGSGARIEIENLAIAKPQLPMLRILSLLPLPLVTILIGFGVWWSRRGR